MQHTGDRHGTGRRHQALGQHFAAEDPLQLSVWLSCPKQPDLDLLQVQKVE
jgi:hypothetical protein